MAIKSKNEDVRSLAFGSMSSTYANVGTATSHPAYMVVVQNTTDVLLEISKDGGATDWLRLPATTSAVFDYTAETERKEKGRLQVGTQFQVRHDAGSAPSEGELNISVEWLD